jgi:hypothetical protein
MEQTLNKTFDLALIANAVFFECNEWINSDRHNGAIPFISECDYNLSYDNNKFVGNYKIPKEKHTKFNGKDLNDLVTKIFSTYQSISSFNRSANFEITFTSTSKGSRYKTFVTIKANLKIDQSHYSMDPRQLQKAVRSNYSHQTKSV